MLSRLDQNDNDVCLSGRYPHNFQDDMMQYVSWHCHISDILFNFI